MLILQAFAIQTASSCWLQLVSEFEKAPPMTENIIINSTEHFQQNDDWRIAQPASKSSQIDRNYALTKTAARPMLKN